MRVGGGLALWLGAVLAAGCAGEVDGSIGGSSRFGPSAVDGGAGGQADFGNSTMAVAADAGSGVVGELPGACVGETQGAKRVDVDMYIMLDRSGSMRERTSAGDVKWDAIRSALTAFVEDPGSEGLGVGLQYFPQGAAGVPESCVADEDCGAAGGSCFVPHVCLPSIFTGNSVVFCLTSADCPPASGGCVPAGLCSLDETYVCTELGEGACQELGDCDPVAGVCSLWASCEVDDYGTPAVSIDVLPDNAQALTDSLEAATPIGTTPTEVALEAALDSAEAHAIANPTHHVVAVLATDGLPSPECFPASVTTLDQAIRRVAGVASAGLARSPAVETFVIGVFAPEDTSATQNLDVLAQAGGTEQAFLVDASGDVSGQFLDALDRIRGGTLDCEFQLPEAPAGSDLDFDLVNVELMDENGTQSLLYVTSPTGCDESDVGWFYDVDPDVGTPTKIDVCPSTCKTLQAASEASVEIRVGCKTKGPE